MVSEVSPIKNLPNQMPNLLCIFQYFYKISIHISCKVLLSLLGQGSWAGGHGLGAVGQGPWVEARGRGLGAVGCGPGAVGQGPWARGRGLGAMGRGPWAGGPGPIRTSQSISNPTLISGPKSTQTSP